VVIIAYFLETMLIGLIHVMKLFLILIYSKAQKAEAIAPKATIFSHFGAIPFFIIHYFFFIFVQSIFVFTLMGNIIPRGNSTFNVFANYAYLLQQPDILMALISLALSHTAMTLKNFILPGEFRRTTVKKIFFQPYLRIFIQQFATILACFCTVISSSVFVGALLIIVFRFVIDLIIQRASSNKIFKEALLVRLKKGQKPKDSAATAESFNSFFEN
jgi:hypothetical protein